MGVLFSSPQVEFEIIRDKWLEGVAELGRKGVFVGGTSVTSFESKFAQYIGAGQAIGVGNGTDALYLTLKALGIGPGDEVITAANTFIATVEAIHHTGAMPVLVDCEPDTYLLNVEQAKAAVTTRTKAIIPVHLYGQMVDLSELTVWAAERNIAIVEDSAQAAGARMNGQMAGSIGTAGCFSYYPDKNLGALGDGGGITTSTDSLASVIKKLRNHGGEVRYQHEIPGFNSRLDPMQAIALELKLAYLDSWSAKRREVASMYEHHLHDIGGIVLPRHRNDESHVFHLYIVRVDSEVRDKLRKQLQKKGILTAVHYPKPVHRTAAFSYLPYDEGTFPIAEKYAEEIISLPMNISVTEEQIGLIAQEIEAVLGKVQV